MGNLRLLLHPIVGEHKNAAFSGYLYQYVIYCSSVIAAKTKLRDQPYIESANGVAVNASPYQGVPSGHRFDHQLLGNF